MKRWAARLLVTACIASYFIIPVSCSPKGRVHPFLADLPKNPILDEPVITVRLGFHRKVVVPAGATHDLVIDHLIRDSRRRVASDTTVELTLTSLIIGDSKRNADREVRISADAPLLIDGKTVPHPVSLIREGKAVICVVEIPMEEYVAGVVANEMYLSWPLESLKAQAVAARSYALAHMLRRPEGQGWDVSAGTGHQVFEHVDASSVAHRAAAETRGIVLAYGSRVLMSFFHSASGGRTADCSSVYNCPPLLPLSSVKMPVDEGSPYDDWEFEMTLPAFAAKVGLEATATLTSFDIERRPDASVAKVTCLLSDGKHVVTGRYIRDKAGTSNVRSLWFNAAISAGMVRFTGRGFGHRVGMSQWGARALAQRGDDASSILAFFYPGSRPMRLYK